MKLKEQQELVMNFALQIKEMGYDVYMPVKYSKLYGKIVNNKDEIGSFCISELKCGITISTVHKPCHECGTGFILNEDIYTGLTSITKEDIDKTFIEYPIWATERQKKVVIKYIGIEEFIKTERIKYEKI